MLNQTAQELVFPKTTQQNIGTLIMFPVRRAFSKPMRLKKILKNLIKQGQIKRSIRSKASLKSCARERKDNLSIISFF